MSYVLFLGALSLVLFFVSAYIYNLYAWWGEAEDKEKGFDVTLWINLFSSIFFWGALYLLEPLIGRVLVPQSGLIWILVVMLLAWILTSLVTWIIDQARDVYEV